MSENKSCCAIAEKNEPKDQSSDKTASLYRMVMDEHVCPYGLKALDLLKSKGYEVEDHHLTTRKETDAFKEKHGVKTTPQTFINDKRIGGYDDLKAFFGEKKEDNKVTYKPIINIFLLTFFMALAASWSIFGAFEPMKIFEFFMAFSVCTLAALKLKDIESFSTGFLNYDLLAQRWVKYGYVYPYAEAFAGIGMLAMATLASIAGPVSLFIGTVGAISVFKAVYLDKRDLKCACVGGDSNVPLGFISLTENLMMMIMGVWMCSQIFI